jgi:RES domain
LVTDATRVRRTRIHWQRGARIIRTRYKPIDLFEDIADPADWPLLIAAEMKTNPRLMESIGDIAQVPRSRRVSGSGASYLMAPFTHASRDRPSRFGDGSYGVLYVGKTFETALFETMHHHARFMAATGQPAGWTSQFREIILDIDAALHDVRPLDRTDPVLHKDDYTAGQTLGASLRGLGSDGIVYPSVRQPGGECAGLFYPDRASLPTQGRHLDYHWDGVRVNLYRDVTARQIYRVT